LNPGLILKMPAVIMITGTLRKKSEGVGGTGVLYIYLCVCYLLKRLLSTLPA